MVAGYTIICELRFYMLVDSREDTFIIQKL